MPVVTVNCPHCKQQNTIHIQGVSLNQQVQCSNCSEKLGHLNALIRVKGTIGEAVDGA